MSEWFSGSGPGARTADGCSVELYRRLRYHGELEPLRASFSPGARVLELGCGAGRQTRQLLQWGATITAVDNSREMLDAVPAEATRILGDIESLRLADRFSVVLLASNLVNHPSSSARTAFLRVARRHLVVGGKLFVERHDPDWLAGAQVGRQGAAGGMSLDLESVDRENERVSMTLRYELEQRVWRHAFVVVILSDAEIEAMLAAAGFGDFAWRGEKRRWIEAVAM